MAYSISNDESCNRRSVRFVQSVEENRPDLNLQPVDNIVLDSKNNTNQGYIGDTNIIIPQNNTLGNSDIDSISNDDEMMQTFKLGNHLLVSNSSLKPNSAVRQLFPCTNKPSIVKDLLEKDESSNKYLITAESLRVFEETKNCKLPQLIQCGKTNENIKRVIERNTLRRSLIRYEPKNKKKSQKNDNSLVELIKQLTCNDESDENKQKCDDITQINLKENRIESLQVNCDLKKCNDKTCSPSSSSTTSSSSSSSSTYKKISDLFNKREITSEMQSDSNKSKTVQIISNNTRKFKVIPVTDNKRQFLSTFAPLSACVSGMALSDDSYYNINNLPSERNSVTSTVYTEDNLGNLNKGTIDICTYSKLNITPDVLAGTPILSESTNEFIDYDMKDTIIINDQKKFQNDQHKDEEKDEEHDDYGFNKRPSVEGVKPQIEFSTVLREHDTELPITSATTVWPYYSERGFTSHCVSGKKNLEKKLEEMKNNEVTFVDIHDDSLYLKCPEPNLFEEICKPNICKYNFNNKSFSKTKYCKSLSPPPQDVSRNYHQTMVYIPYNHVENFQPVISPSLYYKYNNSLKTANQITKGPGEPIYNQQHVEYFCNANILSTLPHEMDKEPFFTLQHLPTTSSKNEFFSPLFSARSTQTSTTILPTYKCYNNTKSKKITSNCEGGEVNSTKIDSDLPLIPPDHKKIKTDLFNSDDYYNGFRQSFELNNYLSQKDIPISPLKTKLIEKATGSALPVATLSSASITSPTSSQNSSSKFWFYAMNV